MSVADSIKNVLESGKGNPEHTYMFCGHPCTEREYAACTLRWGDDHSPADTDVEQYLNQLRTDTTVMIQLNPHVPEGVHAVKPIEPAVANSVEATLAQRGSRYGDFTDHARLCQALMLELQEFKPEGTPAGGATKWERLSPVQRQALTVIMDKVARILSGDPNYDDNWHDIQGYARLVEDRLPSTIEKKRQEEFDKLPEHQKQVMRNADSAIFYGDSK